MKLSIALVVLLLLSSGIVTSFSKWNPAPSRKPISFETLGKRAAYDSCDWADYVENRRAYVAHRVPNPSTTNKPIRGKRLVVHGDFNGDGQEEVLTECFRDDDNQETHKFLETTDYEIVADDLAKRAPHSFMLSNNAKIDTFMGKRLTFGFAHAQNLGNVDGHKGDDLLVVYDWCDWSTLNQARVYSLRKDGWKNIASWSIRDSWASADYKNSESEQAYGFNYRNAGRHLSTQTVNMCTPVETNQLIVTTLTHDLSGLKDSVIVLP